MLEAIREQEAVRVASSRSHPTGAETGFGEIGEDGKPQRGEVGWGGGGMGRGEGSGGRHGHHHDHRAGGGICGAAKGVTACLALTLVAGPVLIIAGGLTLASAGTDTRGLKIADFRQSLASWESDFYEGVSSRGALYIAVTAPGTADRCGLLEANIEPTPGGTSSPVTVFNLTGGSLPADTMKDSRAAVEDPPLVLPSQYKFSNTTLLKSSRWVSSEETCNMNFGLSYHHHNISMDNPLENTRVPAYVTGTLSCQRHTKTTKDRNGDSHTVDVYQLDEFRTLSKALPANAFLNTESRPRTSSDSQQSNICADQCTGDYRGAWLNAGGGSCRVRLVLDDFCVKTTTGKTGALEVDNNFPAPGPGCFWDSGKFQSAKYSLEQPSDVQTHEVNLLVRSSSDPWLKYLALTNGTGQFGMTQRQKAVMGLVLLILGALLCFCWFKAGYFCCKMLSPKTRPQERPQGAMQGYYYDVTQRYYKPPPGARPSAAMAMQQMPMHMSPQHGAQPPYGNPPQAMQGAPPGVYGAPPAQHGAPPPQYGAPPPQYGAPPTAVMGTPAGYPPKAGDKGPTIV